MQASVNIDAFTQLSTLQIRSIDMELLMPPSRGVIQERIGDLALSLGYVDEAVRHYRTVCEWYLTTVRPVPAQVSPLSLADYLA